MNEARFRQLVAAAASGLKERDEVIASALLAILSGQSVFFFGPPGTAKSLIARRLAGLFKSSRFFECLMNRFTTPEELFGPVSIKELKSADRYIRKTEGFLPSSDFAFLDEIWKSSPAILNSLLTILNERRFRNGDRVDEVPLKAIVAASNELPQTNQGLEALYDRFIMRFLVPPVQEQDSFEALLETGSVRADVELADSEKITNEEWNSIRSNIATVKVSSEAMRAIVSIRKHLAKTPDGATPVYVSDRRWIKAVQVARTAALVCGRVEVQPQDLVVLADCLWSNEAERDRISEIVTKAIVKYAVRGSTVLKKVMAEFDQFEAGVLKREFWDRDNGSTVMIGDIECYEIPPSLLRGEPVRQLYIPISKECKCELFNPLTHSGTLYSQMTCFSDGSGVFKIEGRWKRGGFDSVVGNYKKDDTFVPKVAVHAGDDKPVSKRTLMTDFKHAQAIASELEKLAHQYSVAPSSEHTSRVPIVADRVESQFATARHEFEQTLADAKVRVDHLLYKLQKHSSWQA